MKKITKVKLFGAIVFPVFMVGGILLLKFFASLVLVFFLIFLGIFIVAIASYVGWELAGVIYEERAWKKIQGKKK